MAKQQSCSHTDQYRNSLCRATGHAWRSTTADNFRVCQRAGCDATQRRNEDGHWIDVQTCRLRRKHAAFLASCLWPEEHGQRAQQPERSRV